jgi:hypothetical protein
MQAQRHRVQAKLSLLLVVILVPRVLDAAAVQKVDVKAQVPLVAKIECPSSLELAPGETRRMTVRVACNQSWLLAVASDNPFIRATGRYTGRAGGMASKGNSFEVTMICSPEATGRQSTELSARLVSGPLVAGLSR